MKRRRRPVGLAAAGAVLRLNAVLAEDFSTLVRPTDARRLRAMPNSGFVPTVLH